MCVARWQCMARRTILGSIPVGMLSHLIVFRFSRCRCCTRVSLMWDEYICPLLNVFVDSANAIKHQRWTKFRVRKHVINRVFYFAHLSRAT